MIDPSGSHAKYTHAHNTHMHHAFAVLVPTWRAPRENPVVLASSFAGAEDNDGDKRVPESHLGVFSFAKRLLFFSFKDTYGRLNIQTGVFKVAHAAGRPPPSGRTLRRASS